MINSGLLLEQINKLSTRGSVAAKDIFTGVLAGVAMAQKNPGLCKRMDEVIRVDWMLTGPSPEYSPGIMADALLRAIERADEPE